MTATAMLVLRRALDALQRHQSIVVGVASVLLVWLILRIAVRDSHTRRSPRAPRPRGFPGTLPRPKPRPAAAPLPGPEPARLQPPPEPLSPSPEPQPPSPAAPAVPQASASAETAAENADGYVWR